MALKPKLEKLEDAPEKERGFYVENPNGDGFVVDIEGGFEDTSALKGALKKERERAKAAEKWEKVFPGKNPDEIAELVKKAEKAGEGQKPGETEAEFARRLAKREAELEKEYAPFKSKAEELQQKLDNQTIDNERRRAIAKSGIFPDLVDDALEISRKHFALKDGKVVILDEDGDPTGMTAEKFYATKFKEMRPRFYQGSGASGSGAAGSAKGGGDTSKMSSTDKISQGLAARRG